MMKPREACGEKKPAGRTVQLSGTAAEIRGIISRYFLEPDGMQAYAARHGTLVTAYSLAVKDIEKKEPEVLAEVKKLEKKAWIFEIVEIGANLLGISAIFSAAWPAVAQKIYLLEHAARHPVAAAIGGIAAVIGAFLAHAKCQESETAALEIADELDEAKGFLERAMAAVGGRINGKVE